eukprot:gene5119-5768_t
MVEEGNTRCESMSRSSSEEIICTKEDKIGAKLVKKLPVDVKWSCSSCTYLNNSKNETCLMCQCKKPNTVKKLEEKRNLENVEGPAVVITDCYVKNDSNFDKEKKLKSLLKSNKWVCSNCTYENWPKTMKCVLCQTQKPKPKNDDSNGKGGTTKRNRNSATQKISPPRSPKSLLGACKKSSNDLVVFETPKIEDDQLIELSNVMHASCKLRNNDSEGIMQIRNKLTNKDWLWLSACKGILDQNPTAVKKYLSAGGDRTRKLTREDLLVLNEPEHFEVGHTLVHLAICFQREDILRILLRPEVPSRALKRLPSHICPELAAAIRKQVAYSLRQKKGGFQCLFFTDKLTFYLPGEIHNFDLRIQQQIFGEMLDFDVQNVLEEEFLINWSSELIGHCSSRIYPLWNRAAGDCLLDSVLQATWGVLDRENILRRAMFESLNEGQKRFFPRWKEAEQIQASEMNYSLDDNQWKQDWINTVSLAATAGTSLEQTHVFVLAHILRRPIIVYAVKYVKSRKGETIDYARFEGVYLPLLWEEDFCIKCPIALGYTRGHFSALVPMETSNDRNVGASSNLDHNEDTPETYLPLVDHEGRLLPIHFQTLEEIGQEERLLQTWLDCCFTDNGILVAKQKMTPRPALVGQMIDNWLNRFREMQAESHDSYKI